MRRPKSTAPAKPGATARPGEIPATVVVEGARHALLRSLARYRERSEGNRARFVPLYAGDWACDESDVRLAAREAVLLGEVETRDGGTRVFLDTHVRITDLGYARIRALFPRKADTPEPAAPEPAAPASAAGVTDAA
jgi:hypothetical protein